MTIARTFQDNQVVKCLNYSLRFIDYFTVCNASITYEELHVNGMSFYMSL